MLAASHEIQFVDEKAVATRVGQMQHKLERGNIQDDRRPRSEESFAGSDVPALKDQAVRFRRDVNHRVSRRSSSKSSADFRQICCRKTGIQANPKLVQKQSLSCTA